MFDPKIHAQENLKYSSLEVDEIVALV